MEAQLDRSPRRLVGQPLLYAISVFASLGVFLVSPFPQTSLLPPDVTLASSDMIKGMYTKFRQVAAA